MVPRSESNGHARGRRLLRPVRLANSATRGTNQLVRRLGLEPQQAGLRGRELRRFSSRRTEMRMRLGVTDRNRTDVSGVTSRGSAVELRPHPNARASDLVSVAGLEPAASCSRNTRAACCATPRMKKKLVPAGGNDPPTPALSRRCSATELREIKLNWLPDVASNHGPPG